MQDQIESLEEQLEEERKKLAQLQREYNVMSRKSRIEHRRHERLKEADGKSFSADAVNKSRKTDVTRNREAQKPARHSDGSAGETPRDHLSASSGSVFLNEGDVDEYNEDEFEEEIEDLADGDNGDSLEDDSGVGETWEEIGKALSEIPRTPAPPPPPKMDKQAKKGKGRGPTKGRGTAKWRQIAQSKTTNKGENKDQQSSKTSSPRKAAARGRESRPAKGKSERNEDDVGQKVIGKSPTKASSHKNASPRKNARTMKAKQDQVADEHDQDTIEEDIPDLSHTKQRRDPREEYTNDVSGEEEGDPSNQEVGTLEAEPTGLGLFGSKYRYPVSDADNSDEEDEQNQSTEHSDTKSTSNRMAATSNRKKTKSDRGKPSKSVSKQSNKGRLNRKNKDKQATKDATEADVIEENEGEPEDQNEEPEQNEDEPEDQIEEPEQVPEEPEQVTPTNKTSKKPPIGNKKTHHQPKPPTTNKSNKVRMRSKTRAAPAGKDVSTSDEETQQSEDQVAKTNNRASRREDALKARRARSQSRGARSQSRGRADRYDAENTEGCDTENNQKKENKEKEGGSRKKPKGRKGSKDETDGRKDTRPPWKSIYK